jgi:two-component system response regulator HydG
LSATRGDVLVVDDDPGTCEALEEGLARRGFAVTTRTDAQEALLLLDAQPFDVVLTDLNLRGQSGLWLCEQVVGAWPGLPVILITAFGSLQTAIGAIRAGAWDFITKPFDLEVVALALERAVRQRQLQDEVRRLRSAVVDAGRYEELIGSSPAMRQVFALLDRVADTESTVLITGESGTGKELVARALHKRSRRAAAPFVAVNCAAVPENLLESELFGHVRGAFTDARTARKGLFQQAHGGTLFLDEIGELPPAMQPKLLRALQERVVRPVGGDEDAPFDVRLIAATNRDLEAEAAAGRFRTDLYYRINVIPVEVPPLRARQGDVLLLAQRFVEKFAARSGRAITGVSPDAAEALLAHDWPGNVRELENAMERAVALARGPEVALSDLPDRVRERRAPRVVLSIEEPSDLVPLEEVERRYVLRVLDAVGGNKKLAAQALGIDRSTLYRMLDRFAGKS